MRPVGAEAIPEDGQADGWTDRTEDNRSFRDLRELALTFRRLTSTIVDVPHR